ncbi:MAG: thioredoxin-like domain-containing protein [Planctomycetota bacterium]
MSAALSVLPSFAQANPLRNRWLWTALALITLLSATDWLAPARLPAQEPQLAKALAIRPNQKDVDCDTPSAEEAEKCTIERTAETLKIPGWRIKDPSGRVIRQFLDTNSDKQLDVWSFYKNGSEIYRDIDSDFDNKTDQYRWLGSAGSRWGIDKNQDGVIDNWKTISAEEVSAEIFAAIRDRDAARFQRVLLTPTELKQLQLGEKLTAATEKVLDKATKDFASFAGSQKAISSKSEFLYFGTGRPSALAAGSEGNQQDLLFFDHASALFQTDKEFGNLAIGTLLKVGESWRAIELPGLIESGKAVANGGLFINAGDSLASAAPTAEGSSPLSPLLEQFEALEKKLTGAKPADAAKLEAERGDLFLKLIKAAPNAEERNNWVRLAADAISNSVLEERFPEGLDKLNAIQQQLSTEKIEAELDYIAWRVLTTRFSQNSQGTAKERAAANEAYFTNLQQFIKDFETSEFAGEAMMQLALQAEVSDKGDIDSAIDWYTKVEKKFPGSANAKRASGAKLRLSSSGKSLPFRGKTIDGKFFDLANKDLRGRIVVLHYWASWCDSCVKDFEELQRLRAKYRDELVVVGVNIDDDVKAAQAVLTRNKSVVWTQLYEPGGMLESPLAQQLGVTTLPLTILVDKDGHLVDANITTIDLDRGIQRLQRTTEETARKDN